MVIAENTAEPVGSAGWQFVEASEPPSSRFHYKLHTN